MTRAAARVKSGGRGAKGPPSTSDADSGRDLDAEEADSFSEDAAPLDDFEPIAPAKPIRLSDIVLADRR